MRPEFSPRKLWNAARSKGSLHATRAPPHKFLRAADEYPEPLIGFKVERQTGFMVQASSRLPHR